MLQLGRLCTFPLLHKHARAYQHKGTTMEVPSTFLPYPLTSLKEQNVANRHRFLAQNCSQQVMFPPPYYPDWLQQKVSANHVTDWHLAPVCLALVLLKSRLSGKSTRKGIIIRSPSAKLPQGQHKPLHLSDSPAPPCTLALLKPDMTYYKAVKTVEITTYPPTNQQDRLWHD